MVKKHPCLGVGRWGVGLKHEGENFVHLHGVNKAAAHGNGPLLRVPLCLCHKSMGTVYISIKK